MPNVALAGPIPLSPFRHISLGTWRTAYDPSIYGSATIRMDEAERYVERFRAATGRHLTVTHLVAKVVGVVLERMPEINAVGVPILFQDTGTVMALTCGGAASLLPRDRLEGEIGPLLVAARAKIELVFRRT